MDLLINKWDESYDRKENHIFYPKEELVKFLSRNVRRRVSNDVFINVTEGADQFKALDLGCGIGRQTILLNEFGLDSYGVDISEKAINQARQLCKDLGKQSLSDHFSLINSSQLPFQDNFFDVVVSDSVLDSMNFDVAKELIKECDRVCSKLMYLSLIEEDDSDREEIVDTEHESGTVQSFFNMKKIDSLIEDTNFKIRDVYLVKTHNIIKETTTSRYHITLEK